MVSGKPAIREKSTPNQGQWNTFRAPLALTQNQVFSTPGIKSPTHLVVIQQSLVSTHLFFAYCCAQHATVQRVYHGAFLQVSTCYGTTVPNECSDESSSAVLLKILPKLKFRINFMNTQSFPSGLLKNHLDFHRPRFVTIGRRHSKLVSVCVRRNYHLRYMKQFCCQIFYPVVEVPVPSGGFGTECPLVSRDLKEQPGTFSFSSTRKLSNLSISLKYKPMISIINIAPTKCAVRC